MLLLGAESIFSSKACRSSSRVLRTAILGLIGLFCFGTHASADPVVVGVLSFDSIIPDAPGAVGVNGFTIYNFTGANSQPGTPDSAISFLGASLLLNGSQSVSIGDIVPGSVQPADLQFPTSDAFTEADFSATLGTTFFTIAGQNYHASSDQLTGMLLPGSGPNLAAGSDFLVLTIDASPSTVPEPSTFCLLLGPLAALGLYLAHKRVNFLSFKGGDDNVAA